LNSPEFNTVRARHYNKLNWATNEEYLQNFIDFAGLQAADVVMDLGTGTALVARRAAPKVKKVVGLDNSREMLTIAAGENPTVEFALGDARNIPFAGASFDKVLARMVFHHITEDLELALAECLRVLRQGGMLVVSEGVPPCPEVKNEYVEIFRLKEKRLTFLPEDLIHLLEKAGFVNISYSSWLIPGVSVKNWLENSGCPKTTQEKIMQLHLNASDRFKQAYGMRVREDDCLINMHFFMIRGQRPKTEKNNIKA